MFKNKFVAAMILISLLTILVAFSNPDLFIVKSVETNVLKTANILRYDFVLEKTKEVKQQKFDAADSPGHHLFHPENGINFAVRPNPALASLMELEQNTKYVKMQFRGGGNSGNLIGEKDTILHMEYAIKAGSDFEEVRNAALDSTLLVLMGNKVIAEIPLKR